MKIIIPAYEPDDKILTLIKDIRSKTQIEIIVVNDGSGEKYQKIFDQIEKMNIKVLEHEKNKGKGMAIKTAIKYLIEINEEEGCVFADCDGQHTQEDIMKIVDETKNSHCLVLGAREFKEKIPIRSKFGNVASKFLFRLMTGLNIKDTQTGLRGYPSNMFAWLLTIPGERYEYEFNMLLELKEAGFPYKEVGIQTIYENKNKTSHFKPIQDSMRIYKPVIKFIISSSASAMIDFVLFLLFQKCFHVLWLSVIMARVISSIFNFVCNKNYVFKKQEFKVSMLIKYYLLVIVIMGLNYMILSVLYQITKQLVISKIITELILYTASFTIQKRIIF